MTGAQRILQKYGKGAGASALAPKTNYASLYYSDDEKRKQEAQNKGDTLGGVGYVAEKLGLGLMQGIEGIWDYAVGGVSSLLGEMGVDGAQDYAERQIANDWINYNHADEWFNPGEGWKMAGDVAGGIGTSLPGIAATALVTYFTGGAGTAAMIAGLGVSGVSAAGTATKEAYQETGELGGKEFGYGAIMGAVEAGTEALTGKVLGTGLKKTADITTSLLGKGAKSVANSIGKSAAFGVAKEFASEAFEEGFTEFISPYMKRLTYDPNAENATAEEIGYAALVGGLSGVIMGGAQTVGVRGINTIKGSKQIKQGNTESIRAEGKVFAEEGFMKEDYAETVRSIESQLQALEGQTGPVAAVKRARLVGELKMATTNGALSGMVQRSGNTVVQNAEAVAQRLNADGRYKMVDGRFTYVEDANALPEGADVRDITAEDLTKGYDTANGKKAMEKALRENEALRYVAASDAAGRFMMTATEATNAALEGERIRNEAEYKRLREEASAEERAAISQELGVDVNTASFEQFNEAVGQFKESGKAEAYKAKAEKVNEIKAKAGERAYNMPKAIALADGKIKRFFDADINIAIARMGDGFIIYDYNTGKVTRSMTRAEVNAELARYRNERAAAANAKAEAQKNATTETAGATSEANADVKSENANTNENLSSSENNDNDIWEKGVTEADRKAATEARKQAAELDAYCKEKIKDYEHLSAANKTMVRDVVREARAKGLSDADALSYARVSARSGLDIAFDKAACLAYDKDGNVVLDKEGNEVYHAGYYDPNENKIVVNPETTKKHAALLIHELSHATRAFSTKDGKIHYIFDKTAYEKISEDMQKQLLSYYSKQDVDVSLYELIGDEATAYYAEALFGTERAVELLLGEKPTLSEKILSFFKGAARDYAADPKLAREARRQLRQFKALFDSFSARNFGRNAEGGTEQQKNVRFAMNIKEFASSNDISWKNVAYEDSETKAEITSQIHEKMVEEGLVVKIPDEIKSKVSESYPDLKGMKKKERLPILKDSIKQLKSNLRAFLSKLKGETFEFEVEGNVLEAKLYNVGIDEVLEKVTQDKAEMLYITEEIFKNSRYLYSTPDYDGDTNIYRWNYFYTPVQIGENIVGVRIAIRDMVKQGESQIYNWGIKKDTSLGGVRDDYKNRKSNDASSDVSSDTIIDDSTAKINTSDENSSKKSENSAKRASMDASYLSAVERGDMETAQRMVDEAAKKAGYTVKAYHGTNADFFTFDKGRVGKGNDQYGAGFYFATDREAANHYGSRVISSVLKIEKPFTISSTNLLDAEITFTDLQAYNIVKKHPMMYDAEESPLGDYYDSYWKNGVEEWMIEDLASQYTDLGYLDSDLFRKYPNELHAAVRDATGYDGVVVNLRNGEKFYIAWFDNQMKSSDPVTYDDNGKVIPLSERFNSKKIDIRYSMEPTATESEAKAELPRKAARADMTVGQLKKYLANFSRAKTYSRKDALKVVGKIDAGNALTEKTRGDIAEAIWQIYNEALTSTERQAAARDIARYFTLKLFSESKVENPDAKKAEEDLVYLSAGIGSLYFTEEQKNEIKHREDSDGLKRVIGRWGFKGERTRKNGTTVKRTPLDVFVVDIAREMPGMQYLEDMNPVDAFLQIDQVYTATKEIALDKTMSAYWDVPESEIESIERSIENDIMQGYIDSGTKSKFVSMFQSKIAFYEKQAEMYKNEFNEIRGRDKINGMLVSQALKMRDLKIGTFKNATQTQTDTFKKTIESLARIQWRGNISAKSTRKIVKPLYEWYTSDDVKKTFFGYVDESNPGRYNEGIAALLQELSKGESKTFTKIDLYAMLDVMGYFTNFVETYGKVYRRGQWVDAEAEAKAFIEKLPTATETRRGIGNATKTLADKYLATFGDPASYIRRMDNYSDGFFTQIFEDLREAAIGSDAQEIELLLDYDEFIGKNKKYLEKAKTETVEYKGVKIPKIQLIGLYMTMKQQQAHAGIAINGFAFVDTNGKEVRVPGGIKQDGEVTEQDIKAYIEEQQKTIEKFLTDVDREYIKVVEKGYLAAGQAKAYRDMQKYGFTNVVNDYYYPIKRANIASNVDKSDIQEELDRVSNASFNKDRVKGAKQELFIDDADKLYRRHIHAVCQYANLSPVIDSYNMLYNYDIGGNPNHPTSIRTQSRNVWSEANSYFMKLISDVQGITHNRGVGMEAIARIRSGYAKFQLGANPKTWITQLSSIFAASSVIDSRRVLTSISGKDVDKYCALARIRNYDNAAAKAQAVADSKVRSKTDSIGDALMKPIGAMDRFVVERLFAACQSQVEADGGAKVGTEENKIAAGKLLTRVILETQQNSIATERSAAMRSDNEIVRSLTMFRADGMKVIGRVIDSYGEVKALSRQIKATSDANTVAELKVKLKKAKKRAARSMLALATTSIYTALIAQLFKWLYAKERDEDESLAEDFITDAIGNAIGGLPLITDAYSYFVEGFDLDNYSYSAINDFLASAKSIFELADGDFTDQELARNIKNLSYSAGQIFGIPTRNIYNIFYGLTKRISPETGYAIDSVFYEKNYKNDFYKAIEQGDDDMANYILQLLMGERIGDDIGEDTYNTILDLSNKGYKILPKTVPDSVTVDGVEYDLGEDDIANVKALYGEYTKGIDDLVKSYYYANLSDEKRCEAISYYYDLARDKAIYDALGYDRGSKVKIADLVGMENLVKLQIATKGIESDKDKDGNTVLGSKRAKVVKAIKSIKGTRTEKVLMIYAAGYTVKDGDIPGVSEAAAKKMLLSAIMKLKVSKEEKAEIARGFGFTVKNGKIIRDF